MAVNRSRERSFSIWIYIIIALVLIIVVAGAFIGYREYNNLKQENARLSNPEEAAKTEIESTKSAVSALIEVPSDEEPTIANVVDETKLSDQAFFANAQNGDKLLVYQNAKKAILYRPSTNKIIEVSTINLGEEQTSKEQSDSESSNAQTSDKKQAENDGINQNQPGLEP